MSSSFIENVSLLVFTAVLTGLLVPIIKGIMDNRTFERQKRYEADLARQGKIIEAQSQFLDEISHQLWHLRYLAMAVSYYKPEEEPERYQEAVEEYDGEAWEIFNQVRINISKSRRLVSENAYQRLISFYKEKMVPFDQRVKTVIQQNNGYHELNRYIFETITDEIDDIIHLLAKELQLVSNTRRAQEESEIPSS